MVLTAKEVMTHAGGDRKPDGEPCNQHDQAHRRGIIRLAAKGLAYIKRKSREAALKNEKPDGRQTIQQLIGQNQGVTNIDISRPISRVEKYARKYGVDYAITKDKSAFPPKYLVFFKARDADAMTAAFNAYSAEVLAKSKRPSTLSKLHKLIDAVKSIPTKVTSRDKQREQSR